MPAIFRTALLCLLVVATPAGAASFENASRLVVAMGLQTQIDDAIAQTTAELRQATAAAGMPAQKAQQLIEEVEAEMRRSSPVLIADFTRIYAERFSDAEINDLVAFYRSPTGRRLVEIQTELTNAQLAAVQNWLNDVMTRAVQKIEGRDVSPTV